MTPEIEQRHKELQSTIDKLSNGHRGDPIAMSEGIVNISKTLQVMLMMNYVTEEKCDAKNEVMLSEFKKARFGWKHLAAVLVACATLYGLGSSLIQTVWGDQPAPVVIEATTTAGK